MTQQRQKKGSSLILEDCWDTWWHRGLPAGVVKSSRETMCCSGKTWAFWIFTPRLEPVHLFPSLGVVHLFAPDWSEALTHCTLVSCCQALALFVCSWIWIKLPELEEERERSLWWRWSWDEQTPWQRSQPPAGVCCQGGSSLYCRWTQNISSWLFLFHFECLCCVNILTAKQSLFDLEKTQALNHKISCTGCPNKKRLSECCWSPKILTKIEWCETYFSIELTFEHLILLSNNPGILLGPGGD